MFGRMVECMETIDSTFSSNAIFPHTFSWSVTSCVDPSRSRQDDNDLITSSWIFFFPTDLWCLINDFRNKRFHAHWPHLSLTGQRKIGGQNNRHKGMRLGRSPRSGELRTQKLKSRLLRTQTLNVLSLKPGAGQYIATRVKVTARDFFLANFYPLGLFSCIFQKPLSSG